MTRKKIGLFGNAVLFLSTLCALAGPTSNADATEFETGRFRNTYYYMIFEENYPKDEKTESVLDLDGNVLAKVTKRFYKDLLMEGSGKLSDGRVLNWVGKVDDKSRFHVTTHEWGRGVGNCPLKPLKTIAADPTQIPQGALVKIAETVGMLLPDGSRHDGLWRAEDVGSAILHDRIDLYVGKKEYDRFLAKQGIGHLQPLTVTVLEYPLPDSCVFDRPQLEP